MSQQLQITGGAKVRSLEGVITGSTGVLGSLPINGSNGIPQLDVNGKILVSQLPNSVMEYLGTWNAATNTPTLVNGTGNAGDVYLCNVAGTVNFGAGPITFGVGDQVIYSGTIWQKASGSTGTVTSVAITETGDALTITGSPITTSGTINIGFAGTSAQYVAGDGTLVTFPTITTEAQRLITEVYNETGATLTKGTVVYINGGHGNLPTITKALATSDSTSAQTYGVVQSDIGNNNNGYVVVIGSLTDLDTQAYANGTQLYLSSTVAGAWTSTKQYAPAHLVYVAIVTRSHPTQGVVEVKIMNGFELDELHNVSAQNPWQDDGLFYNYYTQLWENKPITSALGYTPVPNTRTLTINGVTYDLTANRSWTIATGISGSGTTNYISKWTGSTALGDSLLFDNGTNVGIGTASPTAKLSVAGTTAISGQLTLGDTITNGTYTYTLPSATGTLALTSDIPSVTNFVTLNTLQTIIGTKIYTSLQYYNNGVYLQEGTSGSSTGYTSLAGNTNGIKINLGTGTSNNNLNFASTSASNTYTFPNATGTIALTTDLSSYVPTSRTLTINGTTYDLSADRSWTVSGSQWTTSGSDIYYNTGNVTVGNTTPSNTYQGLTIYGSNPSLSLHTSNASGWVWTEYKNSAGTNNFSMGVNQSIPQFVIKAGAGLDSPNFVISSSGNVGIGGSPQERLTIAGSNGLAGMIRWTDSATASAFLGITSGGVAYIHSNNNSLAFGANGSNNFAETMRLTGGNVGIGTTNYFDGSGYGSTARYLTILNSSASSQIEISTNSTTNDSIVGGFDFINAANAGTSGSGRYGVGYVRGWIANASGTGNTSGGYITFGTKADGGNQSERMKITASGVVGIGTTSPLPPASRGGLVVRGNSNGGEIMLQNTDSTDGSAFGLALVMVNNGGGTNSGNAGILNRNNGHINFATNNTDRMQISSAGPLLINTSTNTSTGWKLQVNSIIATLGTDAGLVYADRNTPTTHYYFYATSGYSYFFNSGNVSQINMANGAYTALSDINKKKDFEDSTIGLNAILNLKPKLFRMKTESNEVEKSLGFIAQEVKEFIPQAYVEANDFIGLQDRPIIAALVKAIQEQQQQIEELKSLINK